VTRPDRADGVLRLTRAGGPRAPRAGGWKLLYLIGGAARSGKSTLARRLLQAHRMPYFCVDHLTSGLEAGAPALGVRHELPDQRRGELVWPVLCGVLRNVVEVEPEYVVEGNVLLPARIAEFAAAHRGRVRACFLGYARGGWRE